MHASTPPSLDEKPASASMIAASPRWRDGLVMGSLGMLAFSGTLPATRLAVPAFGAILVTSARIEVAGVLGALTLLLTRQWRLPMRRHWAGILWVGFGTAVAYPFFVALALESVPSAHGAVVVGLAPAVTASVAVVRAGERPPKVFWVACVAGVAAVLVFAVVQGGGGIGFADGWLILAMGCVGVSYVEGGLVSRELGGVTTLCWAMVAVAPIAAVLLVTGVLHHDWSGPISRPAWGGLAYACVISMFLGSVAWYRGLAQGGIARIGQLNLIQPLLALLWSVLLLGEQVTGFEILCACVIVASMLVCVRSRVVVTPAAGAHVRRNP